MNIVNVSLQNITLCAEKLLIARVNGFKLYFMQDAAATIRTEGIGEETGSKPVNVFAVLRFAQFALAIDALLALLFLHCAHRTSPESEEQSALQFGNHLYYRILCTRRYCPLWRAFATSPFTSRPTPTADRRPPPPPAAARPPPLLPLPSARTS